MICRSCGLAPDGRCYVEQFRPMFDRIGRHGGRCWGGIFPRSKDYPAQAAEEEDVVQREHVQLGLWS